LRQRKGLTEFAAQALITKSDYYAAIMVDRGDADGMVTGLRLNSPETVRPPLEIFGLSPGAKVAAGMYMIVQQNSVRFFGDTVFNIDPDAETLADITVQMADAVQGFGVTPRVAMISYSNFGSVRHPGRPAHPRRARDRPRPPARPRDRRRDAARDRARSEPPPAELRVLATDPSGQYPGVQLARRRQRRLPDRPRDRRRLRGRPDP